MYKNNRKKIDMVKNMIKIGLEFIMSMYLNLYKEECSNELMLKKTILNTSDETIDFYENVTKTLYNTY